jgi:aldehyde:ferredoxin oxidoreductase
VSTWRNVLILLVVTAAWIAIAFYFIFRQREEVKRLRRELEFFETAAKVDKLQADIAKREEQIDDNLANGSEAVDRISLLKEEALLHQKKAVAIFESVDKMTSEQIVKRFEELAKEDK